MSYERRVCQKAITILSMLGEWATSLLRSQDGRSLNEVAPRCSSLIPLISWLHSKHVDGRQRGFFLWMHMTGWWRRYPQRRIWTQGIVALGHILDSEWVSESRYGFSVTFKITTIFFYSNNSERPVDALAVKKGESLTDNLKSRDASASKNDNFGIY